MVFLAAGAGGRGSVVLTAARACDDGAAINNFMEAPTPELSLLFPHALLFVPYPSPHLSVLRPLLLVPQSHSSCAPPAVLGPLPALAALLSLCTCGCSAARGSASSSSQICSPVSVRPLFCSVLPTASSDAFPSFPWLCSKLFSYFIHSLNHEMVIRH